VVMNTYNKMASEYEQVIEDIKDNIKHPEKTQKDNILKAAKILEKNNYPLNKISAKIAQDLKSLVTPRYIRDVLDPKYKEEEKIRKDIIIAQTTQGHEEVVPHSKSGGKSADDEEEEDESSKKMSNEERSELYDKNKYYNKLKNIEGGKGWGRASNGRGSSWVSQEERESRGEKQNQDEFYNDDLEVLKAEVKEYKKEIKALKDEANKHTTVVLESSMFKELQDFIKQSPKKIYLDYDIENYVINKIRASL
jgi:hypothetical protein